MSHFRDSARALARSLDRAGLHMSVYDILALTDELIREKATFVEVGPLDYSTHEGRVMGALTDAETMMHMRDGKKIHAIKALRAKTLCGLKEAKDAVEDDRVSDAAGVPRAVRY